MSTIADNSFTASPGYETLAPDVASSVQPPRRPVPRMKIETYRARVPWSWAMWMTCPWAALYFIENAAGSGPIVFTLRKFVSEPTLIALITSLYLAFNFTIGTVASYMSDRIWTPWGRRRPLMIAGWLVAGLGMLWVPFVPNAGMLVVAIVLIYSFQSLAKPLEPLYNEIIPSAQRGRASTIRFIVGNLTGLLFYGVLMAQFDRVYQVNLPGLRTISGETVFYWVTAAIALAAVALLAFRVRENPPPRGISRERFALGAFLRDVFCQRRWWMIYLLYAVPSFAGMGVENFNVLMKTEQMGFTKQQLGWAASIGMIAGVVVFVPVAGYLTDRLPRLRLFKIGLAGPAVVHLVFFCYLRFWVHYSISFGTLVGFGLVAGAMGALVWTSWAPLIYDYIPSSHFGTVSAGLACIGSVVTFLMTNLAGVWVSAVTRIFGAAGRSQYDYSSILILQMIGTGVGLLIVRYFEREEKQGRIVAEARFEAAARAAAEGSGGTPAPQDSGS